MSRRIPFEYLCESIPELVAHVEKVEITFFVDGSVSILGLQAATRMFTLLCASPELLQSLSSPPRPDEVRFALSRRSTLDWHGKQVFERAEQVVTVYKRGSKCDGGIKLI